MDLKLKPVLPEAILHTIAERWRIEDPNFPFDLIEEYFNRADRPSMAAYQDLSRQLEKWLR
jgi:hypothetical protein